jgi:hypothetical protein
VPVYDKRPCRPATSGLVEGVGEGRGGDTPYPLQGYPLAVPDTLARRPTPYPCRGYPRKLPPAIGRLAVHRPPRNATPRAPLAAMIALPAPLSPRYVARRPPFE